MNDKKPKDEVWVRLVGPLAKPGEYESTWAIGEVQPHAADVLILAREFGRPIVYGLPAATIAGQRAVMRWLWANDLDAEVTYLQEPPPGAQRIDTWETSTEKSSSPADTPPSDNSNTPSATAPSSTPSSAASGSPPTSPPHTG